MYIYRGPKAPRNIEIMMMTTSANLSRVELSSAANSAKFWSFSFPCKFQLHHHHHNMMVDHDQIGDDNDDDYDDGDDNDDDNIEGEHLVFHW